MNYHNKKSAHNGKQTNVSAPKPTQHSSYIKMLRTQGTNRLGSMKEGRIWNNGKGRYKFDTWMSSFKWARWRVQHKDD